MPRERTSVAELERLGYLTEAMRHRYVALPESFRPSPSDLWRSQEWSIRYEPRVLAVAPSGSIMAVGTKAGVVHVSRLGSGGEGWSKPTDIALDLALGGPVAADEVSSTSRRSAIRGLCFLDDSTLVVGSGAGEFFVLDLSRDPRSSAVRASPAWEAVETDPWASRFLKILPLPLKKGVRKAEKGAVAFGWARSGFLYILERDADLYRARVLQTKSEIRELLPGWRDKVRVQDGALFGRPDGPADLWILDSAGAVHRFGAVSRGAAQLHRLPCVEGDEEGLQPFEMPQHRKRRDARAISVCRAGLALQFGEEVTFVPFVETGVSLLPRDHRSQWITVERMMDCVAIQEYGTTDRAYLAAATEDPGVRWIPWNLAPGREPPRVSAPVTRGDRAETPEGVQRAILKIAVARTGSHDGRSFLIFATRDHRLQVSVLLDKDEVADQLGLDDPWPGRKGRLSGHIDRFLRAQERDADDLHFFLGEPFPGVALAVVRRLIRHRFEVLFEVPRAADELSPDLAEELLPRLLEKLDQGDLPVVLRYLARSWRLARTNAGVSTEAPLERPQAPFEVYRSFCLQVFKRAAQIDEDLLRLVARRVYEDIEDLRDELDPREWDALGVFAGMLRKWFLYGYTYGEKRFDLLELFRWNRQSGRDLDALYYLTSLMQFRVDRLWTRKISPVGVNPATWTIATPEREPPERVFVVHSQIDGRVLATGEDGAVLRWIAPHSVREVLRQGSVEIVEEGTALCHAHAQEFRSQYRHGPYARSLLIEELEGDGGSYLLLFGFRGWRPVDLEWRSTDDRLPRFPRLVALEFRYRSDREDGGRGLHVHAAAVEILDYEVYALALLPRDRTPGGTAESLRAIVGTGGSQMSRTAPGPGSPAVRHVPFVEASILRHPQEEVVQVYGPRAGAAQEKVPAAAGQLQIQLVEEVRIEEDVRWTRFGAFRETSSVIDPTANPAWSADVLSVDGSTWLWLGMHDGRIRSFLRSQGENGTVTWLEGGGVPRSEGDAGATTPEGARIPARDPILTYAPVWRLRCLTVDERSFVAYGTGEGVVGVVPVEPSVPAGTPRREAATWVHVVHTQESAPIAGLAPYRDQGGRHLAALTQDGTVLLFRMSPAPIAPKGPSGLRIDRFQLGEAVRGFAMAQIRVEEWLPTEWARREKVELPSLVVGGEDGSVSRLLLAVPKGSSRRRQSYEETRKTLRRQSRHETAIGGLPPFLLRVLGEANIHPWLRLWPVGTWNLLRFSLWVELAEQRLATDQRGQAGRHGHLEVASFRKLLRRLADEVYGRKPFSVAPAKILWEQAGQRALQVAHRLLVARDATEREALAEDYGLLLDDIDHLANRWIGTDQAVEARVLVHSFEQVFDATSPLLLAVDRSDEEHRTLQRTRRLLLESLVQRRLNHNSAFVPLETVRIINSAVFAALVKTQGQRGELPLAHRPEDFGGIGYFDLLRAVGNLVRHQAGRLRPSDPLYTELSRFFALSILLIPDGALTVAEVVSESGLTEREGDVAWGVVLHLENLEQELRSRKGTLDSDPLARARQLFQAYLSPEVFFDLDKHPLDWQPEASPGDAETKPWSYLTSCDRRPGRAYRDEDFLYEQNLVLHTIARMAQLEVRDTEGDLGGPTDNDAFAWLDHGAPGAEHGAQAFARPVRYFRESRSYLRYLRRVRERLQVLMKPGREVSEQPFEVCAQERRWLMRLANVVRPQKDHLLEVIRSWERELEQKGREAVDLIHLIDRFDRHVYRTSADDLMASLIELALRTAPLPPPEPASGTEHGMPLRLRIRQGIEASPFLLDLYDRGELLVQRSYLAATLLHLARGNLRRARESPTRSSLEEVLRQAHQMAGLEGLEMACPMFDSNEHCLHQAYREGPPERWVPGDRMVWDTIFREVARNVRDYALPDPPASPRLEVAYFEGSPESDGKRRYHLAVGGLESFFASLERGGARVPSSKEELLLWIDRIMTRPGVTYHSSTRGASGFGLFFLGLLCEYVGARASLRLCHARLIGDHGAAAWELTHASGSGKFEELKALPLTFVASWRAGDGGSPGDR